MTGGHGAELLQKASGALGLGVTPAQIDQLLAYASLLQRWNRTYNLTAVRELEDILRLHLLDCMAVVGPFRRMHTQEAPVRLLDVGSGGGLPGVVLAILQPDLQTTCVDAVGKKAAFVQQVQVELGLRNLASVHTRVESLPTSEPFAVVTARAFSSLSELVSCTRRLLSAQGRWMAMKGKAPDAELAQLPPDIRVFHVEPLEVPGLEAERHVVWLQKSSK